MVYEVYTIYDRVSSEYGDIWLAKNRALAVRRFNYMMANAQMISSDCALFEVGVYDSELGVITGHVKPQFVCNYEVPVNG